MLAPTPFAHQVNIRLQQCCVVLVGVYPATPVVCWRFRCFLPGSLLGTTGDTARSPPGLGVGVLCCHTLPSGSGAMAHSPPHAVRTKGSHIGRTFDRRFWN